MAEEPATVEPIIVNDEELDGDYELVFEGRQDDGDEDVKTEEAEA